MEKDVNCFTITGIYPINPEIFEDDFEMAEVDRWIKKGLQFNSISRSITAEVTHIPDDICEQEMIPNTKYRWKLDTSILNFSDDI